MTATQEQPQTQHQSSIAEIRNRFNGPPQTQPQGNMEKIRARFEAAMVTLDALGKSKIDPVFITDIATGSVCEVTGDRACWRMAELTHKLSTPADISRFLTDQRKREEDCAGREKINREREGKGQTDIGPLVEILKQQAQQAMLQQQLTGQAKPVAPPVSLRDAQRETK